MSHPAVFIEILDILCARPPADAGTILPAQPNVLPGVADTLVRWQQRGVKIVGIADAPLIDQSEADAFGARLQELIGGTGASSALTACAVRGRSAPASWARPRPGMLLTFARQLELDLSVSWVIGKGVADVTAAAQAGCAGCVLIGGSGPVIEEPGLVIAYAADLPDAPRVMIPKQGGCWHQS